MPQPESPAKLAELATNGRWKPHPHLVLLNHHLMRAARGDVKRLIIQMPPQHGKSTLASHYFPAWYLGTHPNKRVILSSYEASFAASWGRRVRDTLEEFGEQLFGVHVRQDSHARDDWNLDVLEPMGGMNTAGAGGPITGKTAHVLVIDDPVKNAVEAMSETISARNYEWYYSTALTRVSDDGVVIIIQCMIGSTSVLMANGTHKQLKDIHIGDEVASYSNGRLVSAKVSNWANQGIDNCFTIRTTSGIVATANGRHPFLVRKKNGDFKWVRLQNLRTGDAVVQARLIGEHGTELPAQLTAARSQQSARAFASRTTTLGVGQAGSDRHLTPRLINARRTYGTGTESRFPITTPCSQNKTVSARSAKSFPGRTCGPIGAGNCALITRTLPARSGDYCATTAISLSATEKRSESCSPPLDMYETTLDTIVEITPAGREDVFDVQVDGTENFIANGLVSHNTRWAKDDLAGRLIADMENGTGEKFEVISLPAIAEVDETATSTGWTRKKGEALCPALFTLDTLQARERAMSEYLWSALYQQRPIPLGGSVFKDTFFKRWRMSPEQPGHIEILDGLYKFDPWRTLRFMTIDPAFTEDEIGADKAEDPDYTAIGVWLAFATANGAFLMLLDAVHERMEAPELIDAMKRLRSRWKPAYLATATAGAGLAIFQFAKAAGLAVREIREVSRANQKVDDTCFLRIEGSKTARAHMSVPAMKAGRFFVPEVAPWLASYLDEMLSFPLAKHDDWVDMTCFACAIAEKYVDVPFTAGHKDDAKPARGYPDYHDPRRDEEPKPLDGFLVDGM